MANQKILAATPKVINTIQQANNLINQTTFNDQPSKENVTTTKMDGNLVGSLPIVPAKVKSGNGLTGYLCDIYGDGLSEPATDTGTVFLANGASSIFTLPAGTILFVQKYPIVLNGGVN